MIAACEVGYAVFLILFAKWNADRIAKGKRIFHGLNGALHLAIIGIAYLLTKNWLLVPVMMLLGRFLFDTALALFRGKPIDYVSPKPTSIIDKLEKSVFGNDGLKPKVLYAILFVVLNVLLIVKK